MALLGGCYGVAKCCYELLGGCNCVAGCCN